MAVTSGLSVSRDSHDSAVLQRAAFGLGAVLAAGAGCSCCSSGWLMRTARSAGRSRQPLARHGRQLDPGARRGADGRQLFLHLRRPALDRQGVAVAGPAGARLQCRRLGRGGRCSAPPRSASTFALMMRLLLRDIRPLPAASVHRGRRRHDGAASSGAPARARLPVHADLGGGPGARRRGTPRAAAAPAARHAGVGQPAWRLHFGTAAVRRLRARGRGWRARCRRSARPCSSNGRSSASPPCWSPASRPMARNRSWSPCASSISAMRWA